MAAKFYITSRKTNPPTDAPGYPRGLFVLHEFTPAHEETDAQLEARARAMFNQLVAEQTASNAANEAIYNDAVARGVATTEAPHRDTRELEFLTVS